MINELKDRIGLANQSSYPVHSRIHPLRSFHSPFSLYYVKRDDELGFGISGSKIRKYSSLIPFLLSSYYEEVVIIGSLNSNHVLSICQLFIENGIKSTLFLRGDPDRELIGNGLLLSYFVAMQDIHWFSKDHWHDVEKEALEYAKVSPLNTFVLSEGGSVAEALPGALTLPLDILKNEEEEKIAFDHIFIDAGTGLMAIALILAFAALKRKTHLHVILIAGDKKIFYQPIKILS